MPCLVQRAKREVQPTILRGWKCTIFGTGRLPETFLGFWVHEFIIGNRADQPIKSRSQLQLGHGFCFGVARQSDGPSFSRGFAVAHAFAACMNATRRLKRPSSTDAAPHDQRQAALRKAEPKRLRATRENNVLSVVIVVHMAMFLILDITRAHALY